MATYSMRETQITYLEISIPTPCVAADLGKALSAMDQQLKTHDRNFSTDDCYEVITLDEEIVLRAEVAREYGAV